MHNLAFKHEHKYEESTVGIELALTILVDTQNPISLTAKLDTGSQFCIFQTEYAALLGLSLTDGLLEDLSTVNGGFSVYGHEVQMKFLDFEWDCTVYFAAEKIKRNILGRVGFLDQFRIGLVDYHQILYLNSLI